MTILAVPAATAGSLRQRLVDDMTLRRFSRKTQRNYIRDIGRLATFLRRSPDTATVDDLRRFQVAQQEVGLGVPTMNAIVSALRFFFVHTIERPDLARRLVRLNHGQQQLSLFNALHDERCFLPIHVYDTATARPVAMILRPGKTPSGREVRGHLRRLVRAIRRHWPTTAITIRGDGHYGRPEPMDRPEPRGCDAPTNPRPSLQHR